MQVENKLILTATKQEYSTISELVQAMKQYCDSIICCESCPFQFECGNDNVPSLLKKILSEIQVSS